MPKTFKEYLGGFRLGYFDNIEPMASLGDIPPKGQAGKDSRGVGLHANYTSQAAGTIKPMLTASAKKLQQKNWKEKGHGPYRKEEVEFNEMWTLEDLYSDDNPKDTVRGTGYGDASSARKTLKIITSVDKERQMQIVNTLYNRAKHHANQTAGMRDAMKIFKKWIDDNKIKETPLYNYLLDKGVIKQEK
jgi:hypothetical protein